MRLIDRQSNHENGSWPRFHSNLRWSWTEQFERSLRTLCLRLYSCSVARVLEVALELRTRGDEQVEFVIRVSMHTAADHFLAPFVWIKSTVLDSLLGSIAQDFELSPLAQRTRSDRRNFSDLRS